MPWPWASLVGLRLCPCQKLQAMSMVKLVGKKKMSVSKATCYVCGTKGHDYGNEGYGDGVEIYYLSRREFRSQKAFGDGADCDKAC
jgi:hypothetical protein